ncbi:MAG: hypothetical protein R3Y15_05105 [Rikenellaceae bacterium]
MENNFDFDKVGTRMPYKVPDGFFDSLTEKTMQNISEHNKRKAKILRLRRYVVSSISVAAIFTMALFLFFESGSQSKAVISSESQTILSSKYDKVIDKALESVSDSEIDELAIIAEYDLFYTDNLF